MIVVLIINFGLIGFFTVPFYPAVGMIYTLISILGTIFLSNSSFGEMLINRQFKIWGEEIGNSTEEYNRILLSAAFLSLGMKLGAAIASFVYGGAAIMIAIALLLAVGYFFDGSKSGVTPGPAFALGKLIVKIFVFLTSFFDKVVEFAVKIEFGFLGVDER